MLESMRSLALDYLFQELGDGAMVSAPDRWYLDLRENRPQDLFPFLVEDTGKVEQVYILEPSGDAGALRMTVEDVAAGNSKYLPFMQPSGSQGAQVGPIFKRSYSKQKGAGPSSKIINTTMEAFRAIAAGNKPWSPYFKEILELLSAPRLTLVDGSTIDWKAAGFDSLISAALEAIGPKNATVFLSIRDRLGNLPGARPEYLAYLMADKLDGSRYVTGDAAAKAGAVCPLCRAQDVEVLPNALKGAGINLSNADREGAFSGIQNANAWKKYALCGNCADLLFVYKFHVLKPLSADGKRPFVARIAGDNALILPRATADFERRKSMMVHVRDFVKMSGESVAEDEESLLEVLKKERALLNLTFVWATVGQNIEDVTGVITSVPPSRLQELSLLNEEAKARLRKRQHPLFPTILVGNRFNFVPDLALNSLRSLFYRPGKDAKSANASKTLSELKRNIATAVYHKQRLADERFWDEVITTAGYYWKMAIDDGNAFGLLHEGQSKKGAYPTTSGWIRSLAWWIFYLKELEVMNMGEGFFEPEMDELKPYFGPESGIDSREKAYAFLLGVLYGKVLEVQGAKGVNVGANALTWLKRLTLRGSDLPRLYTKIREKLLAYEMERSAKIRGLLSELGRLGVALGDPIELSEVQTNYYLLLGQSMTTTILKKELVTESE